MRKFQFIPGEFYHLYNRGTEKRRIFMSLADYNRFMTLLYVANQENSVDLKLQGRTLDELKKLNKFKKEKPLVEIVTYCLMPNHFHLLIHEIEEGGISKFMQKILTGYTMYFNKKNNRSGSLFQGKFKATHVADDNYLKYLVSYIHLNPVKLIDPKWKEFGIKNKKAAEEYLKTYKHSSYQDYLGWKRVEGMIINPSALPVDFSEGGGFKMFVTEWLNYNAE